MFTLINKSIIISIRGELMKKNYIIASILQIVLMALGYYIFLPPLNIQAISFWVFFIASVCMFIFIFAIAASTSEVVRITNK